MKTLQKFADMHGLKIVPITYYAQGVRIKRKGFDLIDKRFQIHLSIEPTHYNNGDRWMANNHAGGFSGVIYSTNMPSLVALLKAYKFHPVEQTGHYLRHKQKNAN